MCEEDVLAISKKLEKIINGQKSEDAAVDILKRLKDMPVTLEILQRTRIGMTVNDLRKKAERKDVQSDAKNLIKAWKKLVGNGQGKGNRDQTGLPRNGSFADSLDSADVDGKSSEDIGRKSKPKQASTGSGGDEYRCMARQLILKSLQTTEPLEDSLDSEMLATQIEQCIFDQYNSTNDKYKATIRSRVFNLRDKRNPELRENILLGILSPQRLATMSTEEMASQEMKQLRSTLTKQAIDEYQMTADTGTPTDMFKCGRCGKKNCTYTQAQTRSADEPMTTFVYCRECGYRWKFC